MEIRVCRFCRTHVVANRALFLFSCVGVQQNLSTRFSRLLGIAVHADDGLPLHACDRCKRQLEILEGALRDLEAFLQHSFSENQLVQQKLYENIRE